MEVKKAIKKVIALGAGAIMVGATVMGAMAADLKDYPSPFLNGEKKFDGYIVVGDVAHTMDVIGAIDIANSLQAEAVLQTAVGSASTATTLEGDSWRVMSGDKKLELANSQSTATAEDTLRNITSYIGASELEALGDGSFNSKTYYQYLYFDKFDSGFVQFLEYTDTDVQADHFIIPNGKQIARYMLEFSSATESDIDDSAGSSDTTGSYLTDFQDKKISMLGREFDVVSARRVSPTTYANEVKLTLMSGSTKATLNQLEDPVTLKVGDKEYEVQLTYVDASDRAEISVDGRSTGKITAGDTYELPDGTKVGVSGVYYQALETGAKRATIYMGATDVVLWDTNIADTTSSKNLYTGGTSNTISDADVIITGTNTGNTTMSLNTLEVNMTSSSDYYVAPGEKLSEVIAARNDKEELLFTQNWDIEYQGLEDVGTEDIDIENSGDGKYVLSFLDGNDKKVSLPIGVVDSTNFYVGDVYSSTPASARCTILNESAGIKRNDYFIVTDESVTDGNRKSFVFRYKGSERYQSTNVNHKITFEDVGSGDQIEVMHKRGENVYLKYGGGSFLVQNNTDDTANNFDVKVDFDASGSIGDDAVLVAVNTKSGAKIVLSGDTGIPWSRNTALVNGLNITVSTPDGDDYENNVPQSIVYNMDASSTSGQITMSRNGGLYITAPTGDSENQYGMSSMGAKVHFYSPTSGRPKLYIDYPKKQALPQVFITSGAVEKATTTSGGELCDEVVPINVGAAKLDSEVKDQVGKANLIVVGGPCANTVAAELMGNPEPCRKDFNEGESIIKLFESGGKVSMLVAGLEAKDTRKACEIVAGHADVEGFEGTELVVKTVDGTVTKVGAN